MIRGLPSAVGQEFIGGDMPLGSSLRKSWAFTPMDEMESAPRSAGATGDIA